MTVDRLPPQNIEAEQSVLGSLLIDRDAIITVAPFLKSEDFYREAHGQIYAAIFDLHERREPADAVTVGDEMERRGHLEAVGGPAYLTSLISSVPTAIHVEHYGHIVERTAVLRRLIDAAGKIAGLAYDEAEDVEVVVDRAEQILFDVSQRRISRGLTQLKRILSEYYDRIEYLHAHQGEMVGLPTGFLDLDRLLGGLQPSDLIIVAGRPGMGKSSFGLSVAHSAAVKHNAVVAFFSLEMSGEQLVQRLIAGETGISSQRLRVGDIRDVEWDKFVKASGSLAETYIFVDDTPSPSPMEIRTKCRRLVAQYGLDLVIIDYMQLMQGGIRTENRVQEVSYISRMLKGLARELSVPVIAMSQLSRAVESRQDKRPILSDLRESGTIEQDADVVLFIYREEMYDETTERRRIADIIVSKHRNGPTGQISLLFEAEQTKFKDLDTFHEDMAYSAGADES
jgi:replicative DNA helicase